MRESNSNKNRGVIDAGFELGKKVDKFLIKAGLGAAAIGAVVGVPLAVAYGSATVAGSVVSKDITERIQNSFNRFRSGGIKSLGRVAAKETVRKDQTLAA